MSMKFERSKSNLGAAMNNNMAYFASAKRIETEDQLLDINLIDPYPNQPYQVNDDDAMFELVESIKETGLIQPIIVRKSPINSTRYQTISGHRRVHACKKLGYKQIKAVVKDMDDDTAIMFLIDSNKYRPEILPSEKAHAYKLRMDALKRKAGRHAKNVSPVETNNRTSEIIADEVGDSRAQVDRYIRLNELIPELLDAVDVKQLKIRPAVELSHLPKEAQEIVLREVISEGRTLSYEQAKSLKEKSKAGGEIKTEDVRIAVGLPNEDKVRKRLRLTVDLKKLLPKEVQKDIVEQEKYLEKCIRFYQEHQIED